MNQIAVVTGGIQGIGLEIAKLLQARGDMITVFDRLDPDHTAVRLLQDAGIAYCQVDVSSAADVQRGFSQLSGPVSILVNNAGITRDGMAVRMKEGDWDIVMAVNAKGAFLCAQQALRLMIKQQKGYIVNLASVVGLVGNPGQVNYAASKAAVIAMTKTLAKEYASRNVLVNAIAPGFIQTKMTEKLSDTVKEEAKNHIPLNCLGTVRDVANMVAFLTSGQADYITGQVITVDGGMAC